MAFGGPTLSLDSLSVTGQITQPMLIPHRQKFGARLGVLWL